MSDRAERLSLEPKSILDDLDGSPLNRDVAHSIAISLKRIADTLTGTGEQTNLYNLLTDIAWHAGQSFERGRGTAMTQSKQEARELVERLTRIIQPILFRRHIEEQDTEAAATECAQAIVAALPPLDSSGDARELLRGQIGELLTMRLDADDDAQVTHDAVEEIITLAEAALSRQEGVGELPDDVARLVIAAREVAFGGLFDGAEGAAQEALKALDSASEAFAARVPWDDEPREEGVEQKVQRSWLEPNIGPTVGDGLYISLFVHRGDDWTSAKFQMLAHGDEALPPDPRPYLRRAISTLQAELGDIDKCPVHALGSQDRPAPDGCFRDLLERFVESIMDGGRCKGTTLNINHEELRRLRDDAIKALARRSAPDGWVLDAYDAGLLNDFGGGDVGWWQDYIRAELGRAHDFYQSQVDALAASPSALDGEGME